MIRNNLLLLALSLGLMSTAQAQQDWKIAGNKITSPWSEKVNPAAVLPEYPRPQLVRGNWKNLNGLWQYAVREKNAATPTSWDGKILVPFAIESGLSGVGRTVGKDSLLWYRTNITLPAAMKGKKVLLHFGAVDWRTTVYVNGKEAGSHEGGFDPFSFDITPFLKKGAQEITISVWDPTDEGPQPRGKQVKKPNGIWYTPVTGIWQTVWVEGVADTYIAGTTQTPDIDRGELTVNADIPGRQPGDVVKVTAYDGNTEVAAGNLEAQPLQLKITSPKLWSPESPFLYDLRFTITRKGKVIDEVKSYFAMRKSSIGKDNNGVQRMLLNNHFVFQFGPLDQGWWPDGLYTAPTDEALLYDIAQTKAMGFNMIRKHIKVEPARWYYYCDKLGMLVWQDMPSGDLGNGWEMRPGIIDRATDKNRSAESEAYYRKEWNAIINTLYNFPSIIVWTPFNEAWGQFKTMDIAAWTMKKDPSRLVNTASGGNFYPIGPIIDLHNYPEPAMPDPAIYGDKRAIVLGEYGGLGLPVDGHVWQQKDNWGYQSFKNADELFKRYSAFTDRLEELIKLGLSAAVYTQTTDVEVEINGLMTYDRRVQKVPVEQLKAASQKLYNPALVTVKP
ncbi:Glycosyl hydrolases family 2, TIM barrel domain [Chitinophaga eiseniae]|uniref:Glycosyl hydrolases family 2, TIM barrel domain n=1 Tax=Chitinophaga eiseniae TaxID=634771 RepID=A0A1T4LUL0_9BACT|nr:sugar-binding domain-containing protein [Chitinophaga eiseniae]SJZ58420.1 Glycosyl hydrolases family 2, TIM barrel domain [Chitinophaga eiseniae]